VPRKGEESGEEQKEEGKYPVLIELLCSYEHFKSGAFISHPEGEGNSDTQKRHVARRNKGG
jgi:hypothetical protein